MIVSDIIDLAKTKLKNCRKMTTDCEIMCEAINSTVETPAIIERFHIPVTLSLMKTIDAEIDTKKNKALKKKKKVM